MTKEKTPLKPTLLRLAKLGSAYRIAFILALILAVLSVTVAVIGPRLMGDITTLLAEGFMKKVMGKGNIDFKAIGRTISLLLALYVASALFDYAQGFIMAHISNRLGNRLRQMMAEKIDRLPIAYFDTHPNGQTLSRFTNDVDTLVQSLTQSLSSMVSNLVRIVGYLVMMLTISWKLTIVALLIVPASMIAVVSVMKKSQQYFQKQQQVLGDLNGHIEERYEMHQLVMAYNGQQEAIDRFNQYNHDLYHSAWKAQFLSGLMMPLSIMISNIGYVFVCFLGGALALSGEITIGNIQSFISYTKSFTQPINQLSQSFNLFQSMAAGAVRIFDLLDASEQEEDGRLTLDNARVKGEVGFENVHFGYDPNKPIIQDFSLFVKPGQTVAIVGPTGAGKTTLVKLLMRFYEIQSGAIYLDGQNIRDLTRSSLRSTVSMVLQDTWLFEGSIWDNLLFGRPDASQQEVLEACRLAHVDHFVQTLEQGYDTKLEADSQQISQGQKQLLTIARAFIADPKILILDEATSSVDTRTEALIQSSMEALMKGRTSFVIAHRLSTIQNADIILVLDKGNIVEVGNHHDLLEKDGFYARLYRSQFETA